MTKNSNHLKTLEAILASESFDKLDSFKDTALWPSLSTSEKELLANLLILQGKKQLKSGDKQAYKSFDMAHQVCPANVRLLFIQADALAAEVHNAYSLEQAVAVLTRIITLDPLHFEAWRLWAEVLFNRGLFFQEMQIFQEAVEKFEKASAFLSAQDPTTVGQFFWEWAICSYYLGKQSGEAIDFHRSIEKFLLAVDAGIHDKDLYNDWGNALCELYALVNHEDLIEEAVINFRKSLSLDSSFFSPWLNLALMLTMQYQNAGTHELFEEANNAFHEAAKLRDDVSILWVKWGILLTLMGKRTQQIDYLEASLEKFVQANNCQSNHPLVLTYWAESLMIIGTQTERVELLRDAEAKIVKSLDKQPQNPESWAIYGICLNELGRYFNDKTFYQQAIEKFQQGLSLDRTIPAFWYGLAISHFALGEMQGNLSLLEKATRYFSHVVEMASSGGRINPQVWNDWGVTLMKITEFTHEAQTIHLAVEKFERAIQLFNKENESNMIHPEWLYNYGCALDFLGDYEEDARYYEQAIQVLTRVLHLDPDYYFARFNLALAYSHLGEINSDVECFEKAIGLFEEVLLQDNEDEMTWNELGLTLIHYALLIEDASQKEVVQKLFHQAESKLQQAVMLGCVPALYNLACLFSLTENFQAAMFYLERAERQGGLPKLDDMLNDEWIDSLRDTHAFKVFLSHLTSKQPNEDN